MLEIAEMFAPVLAVDNTRGIRDEGTPPPPLEAPALTGMRVTLDKLENPAYMVNYNFEVEWANAAATNGLFDLADNFEPEIEARSVFRLLFNSDLMTPCEDREELLRFHLAIAKLRLPERALAKLRTHIGDE